MLLLPGCCLACPEGKRCASATVIQRSPLSCMMGVEQLANFVYVLYVHQYQLETLQKPG